MAQVCDGVKDESICGVSDGGKCVIVGEFCVGVVDV